MARGVRDLRTATRRIRAAGALMPASCAAFALTAASASPWTALAALPAAACLQVLGETALASGAWEISFGLAPDGRQGQYQGFSGTGAAVARMLGPLLLAWLVMGGGPLGRLALGTAFLAASWTMGPAVRLAAAGKPPVTFSQHPPVPSP
ncbi:hypothetical protein ACLIYM_18710 [Streptomyces fenghuangensis]|uniref:hypothetical protein n=1 Tax=Streptomyces sp. ICN903 TaxID=2964654 RepID=UPI001EDC7766|nr:hypothetical protein [Streptomyces sp. ICN903]MCG3040802.1 hypothetical protein [Streptomyces sp. ICN903]